ncbi:hypothetical protein ACWKWR_003789, partial [Acinetobacter baumannii]
YFNELSIFIVYRGHEYTIRTLVEQHNIAEAYTLKT